MNNLAFYLSAIYYSLINSPFPGYDGRDASYWAQRIYYAATGLTMPGTVDGRDASFFIEKWYRHLIGQDYINPQGGIDIAVWLQKIWGYYTFGAGRDLLYDGRSDEFWASMILATNPTLIVIPPPTIDNGGFNVSDAEVIGYDVGTPTATGDDLIWAITAGNAAGKFSINASTGLIELAATLNWWNLNFLTGGSTYALTIQVTNGGGSDSATITITVTNAYSANNIQSLKQNELSGAVAFDYSPAGDRDGAWSGVTLNSLDAPAAGERAGQWDGINDFLNCYSAALAGDFNGSEGTISLWINFFAGSLGDSGAKYAFTFGADISSNFIALQKDIPANTLRFFYSAGGTLEIISGAFSTESTWVHFACTWSKTAGASGEFKAYINGVQFGTTQTTLGVYAGTLGSTAVTIGTRGTSALSPFKLSAYGEHVFDAALPIAEIVKLSQEFAA